MNNPQAGGRPALSPDEMLEAMPRNTRWYAEFWVNNGERHPDEHWFITEKLAAFRKAWSEL